MVANSMTRYGSSARGGSSPSRPRPSTASVPTPPTPTRCDGSTRSKVAPGPIRSGDVAALLGRKITSLGPTRDGLIKKAVCYSPRWGEIDFTVPMFDAFMRRWIPDLGLVVERSDL